MNYLSSNVHLPCIFTDSIADIHSLAYEHHPLARLKVEVEDALPKFPYNFPLEVFLRRAWAVKFSMPAHMVCHRIPDLNNSQS